MWRLAYKAGNKKINTGLGLLAVVGLGLALAGARVPRPVEPTDETILWVNHRPVTWDQFAYAEKRLVRGNSARLSETERRSVIELLVDEELLLQRAESLGVLEKDPGVRKTIVHAVIDEIVEEFLARPIDQKVLEQFYQAHSAVFESPARVAVSVLRFKVLVAAARARAVIADGGKWADIAAAQEIRQQRPHLPGSPLPPHVLRRYLGPSLANVALSLKPWEISQPVESGGSVYLLRVNTVLATTVPEFDEIGSIVREDHHPDSAEIPRRHPLPQGGPT
jgi:hypothetical protein